MHSEAAIIVTYNRKQLLAVCLDAIEHQTRKPIVAFIVDNASTDGTDVWIHENGYDGVREGVEFRYHRLKKNIGGAGGFYTGLKMAYEANDCFDAFWVMDDDGVPEREQLQKLRMHLDERDYLSPLVVAMEDANKISFDGGKNVAEYVKLADGNGLIDGVAFPFNGILYSRRLVEKVGFPIKEMFIWGDEMNYHQRCINNGFPPAVVVNAIHVHPADRQPQKVVYGSLRIVVPDEDWKLYCYVRNRMFNLRTTATFKHCVGDTCRMLYRYTLYFTFCVFNWHRLWLAYRAMWDGFQKDLSRLATYRKS